MVIWSDIAGDRFRSSVVVGQRFAFDGTPIENAEVVSPATCRGISSPSLAASISGVRALAWEVGHPTDIRGCRFAAAGPATTLPTPGAGPNLPIRIAAWRKELLDQRTDVTDRISAADRIACMRSEASWAMAGLVKCMNEDDNIDVRAACTRAVGAVAENPQQALGPLTMAFQDREQSNPVRAAAADVIGSFGDEARAAAPVLLEELGEAPPSRCSEMAAKALGRIGDPSGIEMTTEVLESNWLIFWPGYVTGLAELIEHEQAYSALSKAKERCVKRRTGRLTWRGENPDLGPLDSHIRKGMRSAGEADEAAIERTVERASFRFVNGRIGVFENPVELNHLLWHEWLDERLEEFQKMMWDPRGPCGCAFTLAAGIAGADPIEEPAVSLMGGLLRDSEAVCRPGILRIIEGMGARGAPMADMLSYRLFQEDTFRLENFKALFAVDPKGVSTVNAMQRLASDSNPRTREAAVRAMIDVGPTAIQPASDQLTVLLDDPNPEIRRLADRALDLIEAEAQVCDREWYPVETPQTEPSPAAMAIPLPSPPPTSVTPLPGAPVPVRGYMGVPKKPD